MSGWLLRGACFGRWPDQRSERRGIAHGDFDLGEAALIGIPDHRHHKDIAPVGMVGTKRAETSRIEGLDVPFAFQSVDPSLVPRQHEVDFAALFVPPEVDSWQILDRQKRVQNRMLEEGAAVLGAQFDGATGVPHKAGVKPVDLGLLEQFLATTTVPGTQQMNGMSCFQDIKVVEDGRTAESARPRERGVLDQASALSKQRLHQEHEGSALLDSKQFLNISCPIGAQPLAVEARIDGLVEQRPGKSSASESFAEIGDPEGREFLDQNGQEVNGPFAPGERILEPPRCG